MSETGISRRSALRLAIGGALGLAGGVAATRGRLQRRLAVAFGTTVSITLEAPDAATAEAAFASGFDEIRALDRLTSLTRGDSQIFQLNRDGVLANPDPALMEMLAMADALHAATDGAFDVTIQPMWLALDRAAKRGGWPNESELRALSARVDQRQLIVERDRVAFAKPGMAVTLNSLARGLAADRVEAALRRSGIENAIFDTDVLGSLGSRPDGEVWRARVRDPRRADGDVGIADIAGCLATSGDYQYFWSPDFERHHIVDPRSGASPRDFSSVSVLARSGLAADALSTAVFLVGAARSRGLLARFDAEALFVSKSGAVTRTSGFPSRV